MAGGDYQETGRSYIRCVIALGFAIVAVVSLAALAIRKFAELLP